MRKSFEPRFYTIFEISILLGISEKSVRNKMSKLNISKYKSKDRIAFYTESQVETLIGKKKLNSLDYSFLLNEQKNAPVVITYYIYESKMNN